MQEDRVYCKLLILDDEYVMRQGIKHMIEWETEGFKIVGEASNGEEGLRMAEELRPDIVLVDIVMPMMDGIAFSAAMRQRYPKIRIIILSSYDKFEYVKQALLNGATDYILKPSLTPESLLEVLVKTVKTIPNLQLVKDKELSMTDKLSRLLGGYEAGITEDSFRIAFPHTRFRLLGANLGMLCGGYKELEHEIRSSMDNYFETQAEYVARVLWIKEEICCVLLNYRIKDEEKMWREVLDCVARIKEYDLSTFWIYGQSFTELERLKERYDNLLSYTGARFYHRDEVVCREEKLKDPIPPEKFDYEKYADFLKFQDFSAALHLFGEHVENLCRNQTEEYLLKNITKNLLYNFLVEWEKEDHGQSRKKTEYFQEIDNCIYAETFRQIFDEILAELIRESKANFNKEKNIAEICQYIREHYAEDLELVQLARQFNYNYNYLSTYFNQQVTEGFSGYLNNIRIEKACELLNSTPHSIARISEMVGYSDHSYFCRVFKNSKGRTPSQWRRKSIIRK